MTNDDLAPSEVAARIKAARLLRGMTQRELAERLADAGLSGRTVGALERAELEMRAVHRAALIEALGVSGAWFTATVDDLLRCEVTEDRSEEVLRVLERIERMLKP